MIKSNAYTVVQIRTKSCHVPILCNIPLLSFLSIILPDHSIANPTIRHQPHTLIERNHSKNDLLIVQAARLYKQDKWNVLNLHKRMMPGTFTPKNNHLHHVLWHALFVQSGIPQYIRWCYTHMYTPLWRTAKHHSSPYQHWPSKLINVILGTQQLTHLMT